MNLYWMETLLFSITQKSLNNTHNRINTNSIEHGLRWEVYDQHKHLLVKNVVEHRDEVRSASLALLQISASPLSLMGSYVEWLSVSCNSLLLWNRRFFTLALFHLSTRGAQSIVKSSLNASQRIKVTTTILSSRSHGFYLFQFYLLKSSSFYRSRCFSIPFFCSIPCRHLKLGFGVQTPGLPSLPCFCYLPSV